MKEKGFKKYTKEKGKAQSARVSKPGGNWAGISENARVQTHNTAQIRSQRFVLLNWI